MSSFNRRIVLLLAFGLLQALVVQSQATKELLQTKIGTISFDKSITGFQFATIMKERFVYSLNGRKDLNSSTPKSGFLIEANENMDYEEAVSYAMQLSDQFGQPNPDKMMATLKDSVFNVQGHKSFCSSFSVFDKKGKKTCDMLVGVIPVDKRTVLFVSSDYTDAKYKSKFFKTFQSIVF